MLKNCGVTMMELLIVLVIVGILAALKFSDFGKLNEKNKGVEAEANLYMIYNAQKRYALENDGKYYECDDKPCEDKDIYGNLDIELKGDNFTYEISCFASPVTGFSATAKRNGGDLCDGKIMTITHEGKDVDKEGCPRW